MVPSLPSHYLNSTCCSHIKVLGSHRLTEPQTQQTPPRAPAHPTSRSSMVPGWKGGKALPFGGSFGEYSLNDLEEQPAERARAWVSRLHPGTDRGQPVRRDTPASSPWRGGGGGGRGQTQGCPGLTGCPELTGSQPRAGCSRSAGEHSRPYPPPQPFHAAPNPAAPTRGMAGDRFADLSIAMETGE